MPAEAVITRPGIEIDFTRPFFPLHLTTLAQVPSWERLADRHRLRYSQLHALYLNEQTVFFEELLASTLLPALYERPDRIGEDLAADLRQFEIEEKRHSRWFRELNRALADPLDAAAFVARIGDNVARMRWLAGEILQRARADHGGIDGFGLDALLEAGATAPASLSAAWYAEERAA